MTFHPGGLNRTGAGFHRDSRREARMSRQSSKRAAIQEDLDDLENLEEAPSFWDTVKPEEMDQA